MHHAAAVKGGKILDEIDGAIIGLLEHDGRLTHLDIAAAIGLSRSAAATRVHRLISTGQVVVRGVVHPAVLGRGADWRCRASEDDLPARIGAATRPVLRWRRRGPAGARRLGRTYLCR